MLTLLSPSRATAAPFAYATNQFSNSVSVIDAATNTVVKTIDVGVEPAGIAITPDSEKVYVANFQSRSVSVIDTATNTVTKTIILGSDPSGGDRPYQVAIPQDGTKAYVSQQGNGGKISIIDTATDMLLGSPIPLGLDPDFAFPISIKPDGTRLYASSRFSRAVAVVDTSINMVLTTIPTVDHVPFFVSVTPDGTKAYVGNDASDVVGFQPSTVKVIDTLSNTVVDTIAIGSDPIADAGSGQIAFLPDGSRAYVVGRNGDTQVAVVDTVTNAVIDNISVTTFECSSNSARGCPLGITIASDGGKAYVTVGRDPSDGDVAVIDTATNTWVDTIPIGRTPFGIVITSCAPTVGGISGPVDPVQVGTNINTSANFTDSDVSEVHTAEWDWGDGSTSPGTVIEEDGSGQVTGSHTYTTAGVYTVTLTVSGENSCPGQAVFQFVVVYDPSAGFVTGGGWIDSPEGAYTPDPSLTGKANFGFVSKYQKGATVPTGQTEFQFKVANLNFHGTNYQWLVIAGPKAQYKGSGTINGEGDYGFLLTANDGQINGGGGVDRFRIKIWEANNNEIIIYDNQPDDLDDADATDAIEGGSIVIHK